MLLIAQPYVDTLAVATHPTIAAWLDAASAKNEGMRPRSKPAAR